MKRKWIWILVLLFLFVGCQDEEVTTEAPTSGPSFAFQLVYPNETIEIEGDIGSKVIIPELMKDDYIFIGWTDGENHYAGLTEIQEKGIVLTPDYVSVESVFERVEVSMGQVSLYGYYGESKIVGIPTYWHDYLVVGFTFLNGGIEKLYKPASMSFYPMYPSLSHLMIYGEHNDTYNISRISSRLFNNLVESCTYQDGTPFDIDQPIPGFFSDECPFAGFVQESVLDDSYFEVLEKKSFNIPGSLSDELKYFSTSVDVSYDTMNSWFYHTPKVTLENMSFTENSIYQYENGYLTYSFEGDEYLIYVFSNESNLTIDGSIYQIAPRGLYVRGNVENVEIISVDGLESINGVVYESWVENAPKDGLIGMTIYPQGREDTSLVFPSNLAYIRNDVYNEYLETITIGHEYSNNLDALVQYFPNLNTIHVPDGHPYFIEEDGVIFDINKETIYYINPSVIDLVLPNTVEEIKGIINSRNHLNSITLSETFDERLVPILCVFQGIDDILIHKDNPYIFYEDGVIYSQTEQEALFFNQKDVVLREDTINLRKAINWPMTCKIESIHLNKVITAEAAQNLYHCALLESVTIDEDNPYITVIDDVVYTKDMTELIFITPNARIETLYIPETVTTINLNDYYNTIQEIIVDDDNEYFQVVHGALYDKNLTEILWIPYSNEHYQMPDTLENIINHIEYLIADVSSITIGRDYVFEYTDKYFYANADQITQAFSHFDVVNIHQDSPYYDDTYHIITTLSRDVLLAFVGEEGAYEIPEYIDTINRFLCHQSLPIEHITLYSELDMLPANFFSIESLETLTIKGQTLLSVEGFSDSEFLNELGDNYIYYFASSDLIVYVESSMVETYQNHPFWSHYDIRPIE
jgi:hypothetical protein